DAHYRQPQWILARIIQRHPLAHRIALRPEGSGQFLIHDNDTRRLLGVTVGEITAPQNGDAHGLEVAGTSYTKNPAGPVAGAGKRLSLYVEACSPDIHRHRRMVDRGCGFDAGQRFDLVDNLAIEGLAPRANVPWIARCRDGRDQKIVRIESR